MKLVVKEITDTRCSFAVDGIRPDMVNALRRTLIADVPKMAIDGFFQSGIQTELVCLLQVSRHQSIAKARLHRTGWTGHQNDPVPVLQQLDHRLRLVRVQSQPVEREHGARRVEHPDDDFLPKGGRER